MHVRMGACVCALEGVRTRVMPRMRLCMCLCARVCACGLPYARVCACVCACVNVFIYYLPHWPVFYEE